MAGRIGKISVIKRDYSNSSLLTMDKGLAQNNRTRIPGTGVFKFPYKELNGKYRTGLDPDAGYVERIQDPEEKKLRKEEITKLRDKLQIELGVDLGPRSLFWDHSKSTSDSDNFHVKPVKLVDGDNTYVLSDSMQLLTYTWLGVHPTIASSYQSWERGEYPADTQFYVADEDVESKVVYKKKQLINKAIVKFQDMTLERKIKVARQLGLPVSENTKEEIVYNLIDNELKQTEFKSGKYQGLSPVEVFNRFADMKEDLLHVKDVVKQALALNIYRVKPGGKIFQGDAEISTGEEDLVKFLMSDENQDALFEIESQLKSKKLMSV